MANIEDDDDKARKKSPRAPYVSLPEAIDRVRKIYEEEKRNEAPGSSVAQHMGYKSIENGAAKKTIAAVCYFSLLSRTASGKYVVSKDFEDFLYAPDENKKQQVLIKWLKSPTIYADLLDRYAKGLPSDSTLKYDLIQVGFLPDAADAQVSKFKESVVYAKFFENTKNTAPREDIEDQEDKDAPDTDDVKTGKTNKSMPLAATGEYDSIPIRLPKGRKAILMVPTPFFNSDKAHIKAQLEVLYAEDEE